MRGKDMLTGKIIEWNKVREYKHEGDIIFITVPIKNENSNIIEELSFRVDKNMVSGHLWKFQSNKDFSSEDYNLAAHQIMEKMTGTVSYVSLEGSIRYEKKIVKGAFIDEVARGGSGPMSSPACKPCHGQIDNIDIPAPGGGPKPFDPNPGVPTIPIPGVVIIPPKPNQPENPQNTDPCAKIAEKQKNTKYAEKFDALNREEIFKMDKERGYYEKQPPAGVNAEAGFVQIDGPPGSTGLDLPDNTTGISGLFHSHNNTEGSIKIFSPTDVRTFINTILKNAGTYGGGYANAYSTVVTSQGSYTLKFTGATHPGGVDYYTAQTWDKWYYDKMSEIINEDGDFPQNKVEDVFNRFLKDIVNKSGLEVFKVTENTAAKMNYNPGTKKSDFNPCPK
ncbi:hypothetical protein [Chryseobacterium sp. IT-36CA2]|uniref:hypothetical protein n=1 Tax=Chryseobacterium sp. IT-36CA2 TaxID=3026460 RepID=UPI0039DFE34E